MYGFTHSLSLSRCPQIFGFTIHGIWRFPHGLSRPTSLPPLVALTYTTCHDKCCTHPERPIIIWWSHCHFRRVWNATFRVSFSTTYIYNILLLGVVQRLVLWKITTCVTAATPTMTTKSSPTTQRGRFAFVGMKKKKALKIFCPSLLPVSVLMCQLVG